MRPRHPPAILVAPDKQRHASSSLPHALPASVHENATRSAAVSFSCADLKELGLGDESNRIPPQHGGPPIIVENHVLDSLTLDRVVF